MQRMKWFWNAFKNFAILFSFIMNIVLVLVLLIVIMQIFQIKNGILEPLIDGLHASFVGLDEATIDRIIPVRAEIPVVFDLPLNQDTVVVLNQGVPVQANARFVLPGEGGSISGTVSIVLPPGLELPVHLSLDVPVETSVAADLNVRAVIPLEETQLHDAFVHLRNILDPFVRALDNLPGDWGAVMPWVTEILSGQGRDLLAPTAGSEYPWPGFSTTAGDGYVWPADSPPQPGSPTGIEPQGMAGFSVPENAPSGVYQEQREGGQAAPVEGQPPAVEVAPTIETGPPPAGDLGIITATPAP
ncbi:MAG: hypothetical protein JW910_02115 [Anaerolineae bacterium]|nr:hypothetical protein [Anaerolineae bacterium]